MIRLAPPRDLTPTPAEIRRAVVLLVRLIAYPLAIAMIFALLPGCASAPAMAPECETLQMTRVQTPQGPVSVLDGDGLQAFYERQRQLQHGECRLPGLDKPGA